MRINDKKWQGNIIEDIDQRGLNRVKVYIPDLMSKMKPQEGSNTFGIWYPIKGNTMSASTSGSHGSNFPMRKGDKVWVSFTREGDMNSGEIERRADEQVDNTAGQDALKTDPQNQPEVTTLLKTPTTSNGFTAIIVNGDTIGDGIGTPNTLSIVSGRDGAPEAHTRISISQAGIDNYSRGTITNKSLSGMITHNKGNTHYYTEGNEQLNIDGTYTINTLGNLVQATMSDCYKSVNGVNIDNYNNVFHQLCADEFRTTIKGEVHHICESNETINIDGDVHIRIKGDLFLEVQGDLRVSANKVFIKGLSGVFIDGPPVMINGGVAQKVTANDALPAICTPFDLDGPMILSTSAFEDPADSVTGTNNNGIPKAMAKEHNVAIADSNEPFYPMDNSNY